MGPADERRQQEVERHGDAARNESLDRTHVRAWSLRIEQELNDAGVAEREGQCGEPHPQ